MVLAAIPIINAHLNTELGLNILLFIYYFKTFENGNFGFALRAGVRCSIEEALRWSEEEWVDELLEILG